MACRCGARQLCPDLAAVWPLATASPSITPPCTVNRSVDTAPGLTELTRMFLGARSFDNALAKLATAALAAQ